MNRPLTIVITLLFAVTCSFSQAQKNTAPTKWETYSLPGQRATVLLPKMPIAITRNSSCTGEKRSEYGTYSGGVAYVVTTVNKIDNSRFCTNPKKFDENSFTDRIFDLQLRQKDATISDTEINGQKWKQVRTKSAIYLFYNDFDNKRWFEFWVTGADENNTEVKKFIASLALDQKSKGISIGDGSDVVLGDEETKETPVVMTVAAESPASEKVSVPLNYGVETGAAPATRIQSLGVGNNAGSVPVPVIKMDGTFKTLATVLKPLPTYTESARRQSVNGVVKLRVTFLNNGSIGNVTVVEGLSYGLTEQAVATAKKILFVPAKKDDTFVTVNKVVVYSFRIY